jgi:hypothetical protein
MDTSEYSAVHFFNHVCKLMSQDCYHVVRTSQHGNLSSSPYCSITSPARGAATWGQNYCRRHQSRQAKKCVSNILRSSSSACSTWGASLHSRPSRTHAWPPACFCLLGRHPPHQFAHTWGLCFGCSGTVSSSLLSQFSWLEVVRVDSVYQDGIWSVPRICVIHTVYIICNLIGLCSIFMQK